MALKKRTRFILVHSRNNSNVTEDNMEPYHISIFRRSTSMPPLPKLLSTSLLKKTNSHENEPQQPRVHRREKEEPGTNKFYRLNIHTMKKKSARISMRLSSAFGLSSHTIDEQFNFHEQRFRNIDKFSKLFLRNVYTCIEALRESLMTQVDVAEDFEELLIDRIPDLPQQFLRAKRSLLENAFTDFCNHIELYVIQSLNSLTKLFIKPTNLISKRHKKLLDYDSAQSAYDKVKDQQFRQAKHALDLSKQAYEVLNNQLVEELPILYEYSSQILAICLKEYIRAHIYLMQQMRMNIQTILNQIISPDNYQRLNWQKIIDNFEIKNNAASDELYQLTITAKNFSEKIKNLSKSRISSMTNNLYNSDKETYIQTDEIRNLLKATFSEQDLFIVTQHYNRFSSISQTIKSKDGFFVRNGDVVLIVNQHDRDTNNHNLLVDNGITRGYLPRTVLAPLSSTNQPDTPPTPIRHDIPISSQVPQPRVRIQLEGNQNIVTRTHSESNLCLINSSQNTERIYVNQQEIQALVDELHQYASIDFDEVPSSVSNEQERIYIALYDFNSTIDGVLCLHAGERLKVLKCSDDDKNEEWWYVEKIDDITQRGYVPANYIQTA